MKKTPTETYKLSIADTGPIPAAALRSDHPAEPRSENAWLAAESRRKDRARMETEPLRKSRAQPRRLASGTAYLVAPGRRPVQVESRADTVEEFRSRGPADTDIDL